MNDSGEAQTSPWTANLVFIPILSYLVCTAAALSAAPILPPTHVPASSEVDSHFLLTSSHTLSYSLFFPPSPISQGAKHVNLHLDPLWVSPNANSAELKVARSQNTDKVASRMMINAGCSSFACCVAHMYMLPSPNPNPRTRSRSKMKEMRKTGWRESNSRMSYVPLSRVSNAYVQFLVTA